MVDDCPEGKPHVIAEVGGLPDEVSVALAVYGADLVPSAVTKLLGVEPTRCHRKGERRKPTSRPYRTGAWILALRDAEPTDPEQLLSRLFDMLPQEPTVWLELSERFEAQIRIALHFEGWNRGFEFPAQTVRRLAELGLAIHFDLYAYANEG